MRTLLTIGVLVLVGAVAWIPLRMLLFGGPGELCQHAAG